MSILEYDLAIWQLAPKQLKALKETHIEGLPMPAGYIEIAMALDHQSMDPWGLSGICPTQAGLYIPDSPPIHFDKFNFSSADLSLTDTTGGLS